MGVTDLGISRGFERMSDRGGGGGLPVGAVDVFTADPGTDHILLDGRPIKEADYPDLAAKLRFTPGFVRNPNIAVPISTGNAGFDALGDGMTIITTPTNSEPGTLRRSTDGGANFTQMALPSSSGRIATQVALDSTRYGMAISTGAGGTAAGAKHVTADGGATWSTDATGGTGTMTSVACLAGLNQFIVGYNGNNCTIFSVGFGSPTNFSIGEISAANILGFCRNPDTGTTLIWTSYTGGGSNLARRTGGLPGTNNGLPTGITNGVGISDIKYGNGRFVAAAADGLYRSVDDGVSFQKVASGSFVNVAYGNGIWMAGEQSGGGPIVFVGNAAADTFTSVADYFTGGSGTIYHLKFKGDRFLAGNPSGFYRTIDANPSTRFTALPSIGGDGLVAPGRFYMRGR